jgi:hypothetical protein
MLNSTEPIVVDPLNSSALFVPSEANVFADICKP